QWLRCDMLWPNLLTGAQYAHLQATLDAVQSQPRRSQPPTMRLRAFGTETGQGTQGTVAALRYAVA
ncbi:hypothetical protein CQA78_30495, partial [Klebsiella pneumoniae]